MRGYLFDRAAEAAAAALDLTVAFLIPDEYMSTAVLGLDGIAFPPAQASGRIMLRREDAPSRLDLLFRDYYQIAFS